MGTGFTIDIFYYQGFIDLLFGKSADLDIGFFCKCRKTYALKGKKQGSGGLVTLIGYT
jgi:hypothetical protein